MAGARSVDVRITGNNASLKRSLAESESALRGFSKSASIMGAAARTAGVGLAAVGGYAVIQGFKGALNAAGDFQQKLNVLRAVSGGTTKDMKLASAAAIRLGKDIHLPTTTAQGAADAMLELAKGGLTVKQSMAAAHAVLLLSTAAQIDNATAAKGVVNALKTFGLPAKDAKKVVDDFAGAANASTADLGDVTDAMQFAGQGFKALHVPVGDAATAIAEMANAGQKGGVAGAALNVAMTKLANPTVKAQKLMKDLGIRVFDSHGKFVGMRGAIANMSPVLDKMSDKQRLQTLATLGGTRGMRALNIVLAGGTKEWDKTHQAVTKVGQAQQIANAQTSGYKGAMAALTSNLQTLQLQIGLKLLPVATRFVRWLNAELPVAIKFAQDTIKSLTPTFNSVVAAISQVVTVIRNHWDQIKGLFQAGVAQIRAEFNLIGDLIHGRWSKIWGDVIAVLKATFRVMEADLKLVGPIFLAILKGIGQLALQGAEAIADLIVRGIKSAPGKLVGLAGDLAKMIGPALSQAGSDAYKWALQIGEQIAKGVLDGLKGLPGKILSAVTPGGHGNKNTSTGNTGRFRRPAATGAFVAGAFSAGDRVPAMLAGGEAVLNPTQIAMVGRDKVMSALNATGAPTIGTAFATGKKPAASYGGRVYPTGKAPTTAELVVAALNAKGNMWGLSEANAQLKIAKASAAGDANGNVAAYLADATVETNQIRMIQAILANPAKALGIKGATLSKQQRTSLTQALSSAINQRASDYSTVYDLQHPASTDTGGGDTSTGATDPGTISPDAQAQIDQLNKKLGIANYGKSLSDSALAVFGGSGDIGMGGANAYGAASGGPNIIINTLLPGDPKTLAAVGAAATGGMALQPFITSPRLSLNI